MRPVLIVGDSGLLGQALVTVGRSRGLPIRGASRRSRDILLDAGNPEALANVLDEIGPGIVINASGLVDINQCQVDPAMAWMQNARMPGLLAEECFRRTVQLVQVSSDHFFVGDGDAPHDEDSPVTLVNEYARSKYAGELLALRCPGTLVIRTNIVGFRGRPASPTFLEWLLAALESGAPVDLFDDFFTSSISTAQCANALYELLDKGATGRVNLAAREGASKARFAEEMARASGLSMKSCRLRSVRSISGAPRAESLVLDVGRAERALGFPLPSLAEVVAQLAEEYRGRPINPGAKPCGTTP